MQILKKAKTILTGLSVLLSTTPAMRAEAAARNTLRNVSREEDIDDRVKAKYCLKLDMAKKALGTNWVMHPEYVPIPRHSNHQDIWWPNRTLKYPEVRYSKERMSPAARAAQAGFPSPLPHLAVMTKNCGSLSRESPFPYHFFVQVRGDLL